MGCEHTMLTYTRCMDSALCVPLMIDAAVFCDYLAARGASQGDAATALAYLFKVNEGAAAGVDPGFFNQSATLGGILDRLPAEPLLSRGVPARWVDDASSDAGGRCGAFEGGVLCAGLSCLDMQLLKASTPSSREAIAPFTGCVVRPGGSAPNTASALRALGADAGVLTCAGDDFHGAELEKQFGLQGVDTSLLLQLDGVSTSLAVLPVFEAGGRGCWVDLSANDRLTPALMLDAMCTPGGAAALSSVRALHVGYPHLLKGLQGGGLRDVLDGGTAAITAAGGAVTRGGDDGGPPLRSVDINGATLGAFADADGVLAPALSRMDLLHANLEEACHVVGIEPRACEESTATDEELASLVEPLLDAGVAVVAVTLGKFGAYVAVTKDLERLQSAGGTLARATAGWEAGGAVRLPALPVSGEVNANGAGDAFTAGMIAAMLWRRSAAEPLSLEETVGVALASARQRVDAGTEARELGQLLR